MEKMPIERVREKIRSVNSLPTIPSVVKKMCTMVESPTTSANDLGELISKDQVLSAKVLKLVNSPFYGFSGRISTITHAIVLLGFNVVKGIVLSASVFDIMEQTFQGLWKHSLGCSVICQYMARRLQVKDPEEISVAGLLHDLGKVAISTEFPHHFEEILAYQKKHDAYLHDAEIQVLGVDHAMVGSWLTKHWNLPSSLQEPVYCHHNPKRAKHTQTQTAIVAFSNNLTKALGFGSSGDDNAVGSIDPLLLRALDLDLKRDMPEILAETRDLLDEASDFDMV